MLIERNEIINFSCDDIDFILHEIPSKLLSEKLIDNLFPITLENYIIIENNSNENLTISVKSNCIDKISVTPCDFNLSIKGFIILKLIYSMTTTDTSLLNERIRFEVTKENKTIINFDKKINLSINTVNDNSLLTFKINKPNTNNYEVSDLDYSEKKKDSVSEETNTLIKEIFPKNLSKELKHLNEKMLNLKYECKNLEENLANDENSFKSQFNLIANIMNISFNEVNEKANISHGIYHFLKRLSICFLIFIILGQFLSN